MPAMADIVVKKNDAVTDVTYVAKSPSSGNQPAVWRNDSVGTAASHRPELRLSFKDSSDSKSRVGRCTFTYPESFLNSTTGQTTVVQRPFATADFKFDKNVASATINEYVTQFTNLLSSTLVRQCVKDGFSAT